MIDKNKSLLSRLSNIHKKFIKGKKTSQKFIFSEDDDDAVGEITEHLASVDPISPDSSDNEHSISDGKGGRIELELDDEIKKK